jgi:hypothetical protein
MKTVLAVVAAFLLSTPPSQVVCGSGQGSNTAAGGTRIAERHCASGSRGAYRTLPGFSGSPNTHRVDVPGSGCNRQLLAGNKTKFGRKHLMQAVDSQSWDPSVKALTEFPSMSARTASSIKRFGRKNHRCRGSPYRLQPLRRVASGELISCISIPRCELDGLSIATVPFKLRTVYKSCPQ